MPSNEIEVTEIEVTEIQSGSRPVAGRLSVALMVYIAVAFCLAIAVSMTVGVPPASAGDGNEEKAAEPSWQRLDKALALAKDSGKLIIVNFYTDWCPNCRRMNEKTYRDEGVLKQLSKSFISVKLNAESSPPPDHRRPGHQRGTGGPDVPGEHVSHHVVPLIGRPPHLTRPRVLRPRSLRSHVALCRRRMVRENGLRHVHGAGEEEVNKKRRR